MLCFASTFPEASPRLLILALPGDLGPVNYAARNFLSVLTVSAHLCIYRHPGPYQTRKQGIGGRQGWLAGLSVGCSMADLWPSTPFSSVAETAVLGDLCGEGGRPRRVDRRGRRRGCGDAESARGIASQYGRVCTTSVCPPCWSRGDRHRQHRNTICPVLLQLVFQLTPPPASRLRRRASNAPRYTVASDLPLCLHYAPGTQHHWAGALSSVGPIRCAATGFFCPALCRAPSFSYIVFCCLPYASVRCVLRSFVSFVSLPFPYPGTPPFLRRSPTRKIQKMRKCENAQKHGNAKFLKNAAKIFHPHCSETPIPGLPQSTDRCIFFFQRYHSRWRLILTVVQFFFISFLSWVMSATALLLLLLLPVRALLPPPRVLRTLHCFFQTTFRRFICGSTLTHWLLVSRTPFQLFSHSHSYLRHFSQQHTHTIYLISVRCYLHTTVRPTYLILLLRIRLRQRNIRSLLHNPFSGPHPFLCLF